ILLLLFIPLVSFGQNDFIGSVERISNEIDDFISKDSKIEIIAKGFSWSEGPVWSKKLNAVLFSDVPNNVIYKWDEINGLDVFLNEIGYSGIVTNSKKGGTNGLTIDQQGNLIICMHGDRRIVKLEDWQSNKVVPIATSFNKKLFNSPNDLVYNSKNELFFTDPPYGFKNGDNDELKELQFNGVFRLSPNGDLKLLIKNLSLPNGIAISNDEETLYVANSDSKSPVIMKYQITDYGVVNPEIFFDGSVLSKKDIGAFDGLKIHPSGTIFATGPGGVLLIKSDGNHIGTIRTEVRSANCAFDDKYEYLYMTSHQYLTRIKLIN
ncbi:SMP-30/gluconolactonase/LRE family protein, partial [Flavobacteriaceae bacterium]|nr:SMP-30/gluconolactonase/LRE family protein [Flavobacteriaceae bacterium]